VDFPELLARWYADWSAHRDTGSRSGLRVDLVRGPLDRPKRAAWLGAESDRALGSLTVWGSGELEVEVVDVATEVRTLVVSARLAEADELEPQVARFLRACRRAEEPDEETV
jgi:hypothetical protein